MWQSYSRHSARLRPGLRWRADTPKERRALLQGAYLARYRKGGGWPGSRTGWSKEMGPTADRNTVSPVKQGHLLGQAQGSKSGYCPDYPAQGWGDKAANPGVGGPEQGCGAGSLRERRTAMAKE